MFRTKRFKRGCGWGVLAREAGLRTHSANCALRRKDALKQVVAIPVKEIGDVVTVNVQFQQMRFALCSLNQARFNSAGMMSLKKSNSMTQPSVQERFPAAAANMSYEHWQVLYCAIQAGFSDPINTNIESPSHWIAGIAPLVQSAAGDRPAVRLRRRHQFEPLQPPRSSSTEDCGDAASAR